MGVLVSDRMRPRVFSPATIEGAEFSPMQQRDKLKPILFSIIKHSSQRRAEGADLWATSWRASWWRWWRRRCPSRWHRLGSVAGTGPLHRHCRWVPHRVPRRQPAQISGPTAAFATIVAGIVATDGMEGPRRRHHHRGHPAHLHGPVQAGRPYPLRAFTITTGFTAGIAVTLTIGQLKDFFGLTYPPGTATVETTEKLPLSRATCPR